MQTSLSYVSGLTELSRQVLETELFPGLPVYLCASHCSCSDGYCVTAKPERDSCHTAPSEVMLMTFLKLVLRADHPGLPQSI